MRNKRERKESEQKFITCYQQNVCMYFSNPLFSSHPTPHLLISWRHDISSFFNFSLHCLQKHPQQTTPHREALLFLIIHHHQTVSYWMSRWSNSAFLFFFLMLWKKKTHQLPPHKSVVSLNTTLPPFKTLSQF